MEWVHCHIAGKPVVAPWERFESIPAAISEIVMQLVAKTPSASQINPCGKMAVLLPAPDGRTLSYT